MSWDWRKALQMANPSAAATAVTGVASAARVYAGLRRGRLLCTHRRPNYWDRRCGQEAGRYSEAKTLRLNGETT